MSAPSIASSCGRVSAISRTGPAASRSVACSACGSHLAQSHSGIRSAGAQTQIRTSSGEWNAASWAVIARIMPRAAAGSPATQTRLNARRDMPTGSSGTRAWVRMKRRSAPAHSGSRSSAGLVCGGTSRTPSCWVPVPSRMVPKSASCGRRSHTRACWLAAITHHSAAGSGLVHSSACRCALAARRTCRRVWPR